MTDLKKYCYKNDGFEAIQWDGSDEGTKKLSVWMREDEEKIYISTIIGKKELKVKEEWEPDSRHFSIIRPGWWVIRNRYGFESNSYFCRNNKDFCEGFLETNPIPLPLEENTEE